MERLIEFDYFYGMQAEMYSFYRVPKILFTDEYFKDLSCEAKMVYGLMLDRMSLSVKNQWFDEDGRVYIFFTVEEVMELLHCCKSTAVKCIAELDSKQGIGLIEKKRLGFGKANVIYVKNFMAINGNNGLESIENTQKSKKWTSRSIENGLQEVQKTDFKKYENYTSRSMKNRLQEVQEIDRNNTYINNTEYKETDFNQSNQRWMDKMENRKLYSLLIKKNIEYDALCHTYSNDQIDGIVDLMVDAICDTQNTLQINSERIPREVVKSRFLKINYMHVQYVLSCMERNTKKIHNIRNYLLTTLYNAPVTMEQFYEAEVNHDMNIGEF